MKITRSPSVTMLFALFVAPIAASTAEPTKNVLPGVQVIEVEDMQLTSAQIKTGLAPGKVVELLAANALATTKISLPKGQYAANVLLKANHFDKDGFFISADNKVKRTTTGHLHNQWVHGQKFLIFKSDGENPVTLRLSSRWKDRPEAECGMLIDRIEIVEFTQSADVLDYWTE